HMSDAGFGKCIETVDFKIACFAAESCFCTEEIECFCHVYRILCAAWGIGRAHKATRRFGPAGWVILRVKSSEFTRFTWRRLSWPWAWGLRSFRQHRC